RREVERLPEHVAHEVARSDWLPHVKAPRDARPERGGISARPSVPSTGVIEQLAYRDVGRPRIGDAARWGRGGAQDGEHCVVEVKTSILDQLEDGDRGDALGNPRQQEGRGRLGGPAGFDVGPAVPARHDETAVHDERKSGAWNLELAHQPGDDSIEAL